MCVYVVYFSADMKIATVCIRNAIYFVFLFRNVFKLCTSEFVC